MQDEKEPEIEYGPDIITLSDENGEDFEFEVLDRIETDTGRYVALMPALEDAEAEDGDLVIAKIQEEEDGDYFVDIEDDDEYDTVADLFIDRLKEEFDIDEE